MNQNKLDIEIRPDAAMGHYSNLAIITHSSSEFIIDFVQHMPGIPKAQVNSRIIMTPENAKRLLAALTDNMQKFESQFGEIKLPEPAAPIIPPVSNPAQA
ncbi:MAG: DUF3467 domain-containing protein [Bacteroidales bacterium]|nr:DUF3467 domain-containing protein [Candidatus Cacconaster equi]